MIISRYIEIISRNIEITIIKVSYIKINIEWGGPNTLPLEEVSRSRVKIKWFNYNIHINFILSVQHNFCSGAKDTV